VSVWLESAALLTRHGHGGLAAAIGQAMDGRRIGHHTTFALTGEEQLQVNAVLQDWLGTPD
jgi:hypothetical protein